MTPIKYQTGLKHERVSHLKELNKLYNFKGKHIWVYGAGQMGQQLQNDLKVVLNLKISGYIDQNPEKRLSDGTPVINLDSYLDFIQSVSYELLILVASRHWQAISDGLAINNFSEPDDFLRIGYYCETVSPLEFEWFYAKHYYDAFEPIRNQRELAILASKFDATAIYDYYSSRQGEFTINEGIYLEQAVLRSEAQTVLELGPGRGKSTLFIAKGLLENSGHILVSVDLFGWKDTHIENKLLKTYGYDFLPEFLDNTGLSEEHKQLIEAKQMDVMQFLATDKLKYDLVFIDLFHTYNEIMEVFKYLGDRLVANAQVIFHDYSPGWPGEVKAIDELLDQGILELVSSAIPGSLIHCTYRGNL